MKGYNHYGASVYSVLFMLTCVCAPCFIPRTVYNQEVKIVDFAGRPVQYWIDKSLRGRRFDRVQAVIRLGYIGLKSSESIQPLTALLKDPVRDVAQEALKALKQCHRLDVIDLATIHYLIHSDVFEENDVVDTLVQIGDRASPVLIDELKNKDKRGSPISLLALRNAGPKSISAVPLIIPFLDDPDDVLQELAIDALGRMGKSASGSVAKLTSLFDQIEWYEWLDNRKNIAFQENAEPLMRSISSITGSPPTRIQIATRSYNSYLRWVAYFAIGRCGLPDKATYQWAQAGIHDEVPIVRSRAVSLFGESEEIPDSVRKLLQALRDPNQLVERSALAGLSQFNPIPEKAIREIKRKIKNDPDISSFEINLIGDIGPKASDCLQTVIHGIKSDDMDLSLSCVEALVKLDPSGDHVIDSLIKALRDESETVRNAACYGLYRIGPKAARATLDLNRFRKLNDMIYIRAEAMNAVKKRFNPLNQPRTPSPKAVVVTLGEIGANQDLAVRALIEALHGPDREVRILAAETLGKLGEKAASAVPALISILNGTDPYFACVAAEVLGDIGPAAKISVDHMNKKMENRAWKYNRFLIVAIAKLDKHEYPLVDKILNESDDLYLWALARSAQGVKSMEAEILVQEQIDNHLELIGNLKRYRYARSSNELIEVDHFIHDLEQYGVNARIALPMLETLSQSRDPFVKRRTRAAIKKIIKSE